MARYETPAHASDDPAYLDCFRIHVERQVSLSEFVSAFYTTWLFRLERVVLRAPLRLPSTDADALAVAQGEIDSFAAWTIEERTEDQLLMCAIDNRTRSWFRVNPEPEGTTLYFGSAVLPKIEPETGRARLGGRYGALLGAHRLYSRLLLGAARRKLAP